jgi:nucleotide-binding universal stress UspA family protein
MFKRICIPVLDGETTRRITKWGFEFAQKIGAAVVVTHVTPAKTLSADGATDALLEDWHWFGEQLGVNTELRAASGPNVAEAICAVARETKADLIFMPTRAREGVSRLLLGSVAEAVTRLSMVPVMLVRWRTPAQALEFARVLVPVDGSPESNLALRQAKQVAHTLHAALHVVHVVEDLPTHYVTLGNALDDRTWQAFQDAVNAQAKTVTDDAVRACAPLLVHVHVVHSQGMGVAAAINGVAEETNAQLIVMGTHGRTGVNELLLGSVAQGVAHHANVPVLLVSLKQQPERWQPSVLEVLAQEVTEERARKAKRPQG